MPRSSSSPRSAAMRTYTACAEVEHAEPNYYVYPDMLPNDPDYGRQWALPKIQADKALDLYAGWHARCAPLRPVVRAACALLRVHRTRAAAALAIK